MFREVEWKDALQLGYINVGKRAVAMGIGSNNVCLNAQRDLLLSIVNFEQSVGTS